MKDEPEHRWLQQNSCWLRLGHISHLSLRLLQRQRGQTLPLRE